jgi:hypothetical protein
MANKLPDFSAKFRWRNADIQMRGIAERYGFIDMPGDTPESLHLGLAELDRMLFPDGFGRNQIKEQTEAQRREWMCLVLRAWARGIREYLPEPDSAADVRDAHAATWAKYQEEEIVRQREAAEKNKPKFELAWTALRELKLLSVLVEFSGESDSGQIDSLEPTFHEPQGIAPSEREFADIVAALLAKEVLVPGEAVPIKLTELIEALSDYMLVLPGIPDWYNNDGGCGTLEWRIDPDGANVLTVTVNQRVTEYDTTVITYCGLGEKVTAIRLGRTY